MLIRPSAGQRGTSIVELTVVVTIIAVLAMLAIPSFSEWIENTRIRATAESVQTGLQITRSEAVRKNTRVEFRLSDNLGSAGATGWSIVQTNASSTPLQQKNDGEKSATIVITSLPSGADTITFDGTGRAWMGNGGKNPDGSAFISQLDIDSATLSASASRNLRILIDTTGGRIRMCDPSATTTGDPRKC